MGLITTQVFFDDKIDDYNRLITRSSETVPRAWVTHYKKNVVKITPKSKGGGWLRKSIVTRMSKGRGEIGWRASYATSQNRGWHKQAHTVRGRNRRDGGGGTIKPDTYPYIRYTTAGTGSGFMKKALDKTNREVPAILREERLIV